jgi:hypothetical protein
MTVSIRSTAIGPVVVSGDILVSLNDVEPLLALCAENSTLLEDIKQHIKEEIQSNLGDLLEAITSESSYAPSKIYSYVGSYQQYLNFKQLLN